MQQSSQQSLFGDLGPVEIPDLKLPDCQPWSNIEKLKREKNIASFFISGHPLDEYKFDIDTFCNTTIKRLKENMAGAASREVFIAGIVSKVRHEIAKNGNPYGKGLLCKPTINPSTTVRASNSRILTKLLNWLFLKRIILNSNTCWLMMPLCLLNSSQRCGMVLRINMNHVFSAFHY